MDWQSIKAIAAQYVHRSDINFDTFQSLANDDIDQVLTVQENESVSSLVLASSALSGAFSASVPTDYARARSVFDASGVEMSLTDINGLVGRPGSSRHCAISGGKLYAYVGAVTLIYSSKAPILTGTLSSWLSDKYSTVLVYGLLKHATQMIQDFEARDAHQGAFDYAVGMGNSNYSMATLAAGSESRSPYLAVSN